jgi:hypothetical protein
MVAAIAGNRIITIPFGILHIFRQRLLNGPH